MSVLLRLPGAADPVRVLVEGVDEALAVNTPYFHRLVIRRCHQSLAVTGEGNAAYSSCVGFKNC